MTASEIIEQIKTLPPEEREEIIRYLRKLPEPISDEVSPEIKALTQETLEKYDTLFRKLAQ
jgi:hypothetical protein